MYLLTWFLSSFTHKLEAPGSPGLCLPSFSPGSTREQGTILSSQHQFSPPFPVTEPHTARELHASSPFSLTSGVPRLLRQETCLNPQPTREKHSGEICNSPLLHQAPATPKGSFYQSPTTPCPQHLNPQACPSQLPTVIPEAGVYKGQGSQLELTTLSSLPSSDLLPTQTEAGDAATDSARSFFAYFLLLSYLGHGT